MRDPYSDNRCYRTQPPGGQRSEQLGFGFGQVGGLETQPRVRSAREKQDEDGEASQGGC
jgi:hypothetical protein